MRRASRFRSRTRNICSVVDFGEADGEVLPRHGVPRRRAPRSIDEPLREGARSCPVSLGGVPTGSDRRRRRAGSHAAHNVTDAHGSPLHVVHRDVTPRNLFLLYDGVAKVLDFGIASAATTACSAVSDELRGNLSYMAPSS